MVKAATDQEVEGFGSGATSIVEREGLNGTAVAGLAWQIQRLIARIDAEQARAERYLEALERLCDDVDQVGVVLDGRAHEADLAGNDKERDDWQALSDALEKATIAARAVLGQDDE